MEKMLLMLKALSDMNRLRIIQMLLADDVCVGALSRELSISESAVSQHLKVLRAAGLVKGERRGYFTHYQVRHEALEKLTEEIACLSKIEKNMRICEHSSCGNEKKHLMVERQTKRGAKR